MVKKIVFAVRLCESSSRDNKNNSIVESFSLKGNFRESDCNFVDKHTSLISSKVVRNRCEIYISSRESLESRN